MFDEFPETGISPKRAHEASLTMEELMAASKWARPALLGARRPDADPKMEDALWRKAREEVSRGECRGPFSAQQLDERHKSGWLAAKRFGVPQKED